MRRPLRDLNAVPYQSPDFRRIIGQQAHAREAQKPKHTHCGKIDPLIVVKAQLFVGIDGVESVVLQSIGAQLVDKANAATRFGRDTTRRRPRFLRWP